MESGNIETGFVVMGSGNMECGMERENGKRNGKKEARLAYWPWKTEYACLSEVLLQSLMME